MCACVINSRTNPPPQARDVDESRYMYDQLAVLSPVMLALTAATPVLKGRLVDTDVRWNTIALSVDDRTPAERGLLDGDAVSFGRFLFRCAFFLKEALVW